MTLQQKKAKKFEEALEIFRKYRAKQEKLLADGYITKDEYLRRVSKKADELDL